MSSARRPGEDADHGRSLANPQELDVSVLFGILMYGLFAVAIHALVEWLDRKLTVTSPSRSGCSRPRPAA